MTYKKHDFGIHFVEGVKPEHELLYTSPETDTPELVRHII